MSVSKKTLIIIPAYNEADNIEKVVENLISNFPQYDYIIVNDGSTDRTNKTNRYRNIPPFLVGMQTCTATMDALEISELIYLKTQLYHCLS